MTSKVIYTGDLSTDATHLKSGKTIVTDAPTDNNGKGEAFSPTDLMATSLASCMLTIMGISARNHGIDMSGSKAEVTKIMTSEGPRKIKEIQVKLSMPNKLYSEKDKKILLAAAASCPVGRSLHSDVVQNIEIHWDEH